MMDILQMHDAMIRYHFREDPDALTDEQYAARIKELKWLADEGFLSGRK